MTYTVDKTKIFGKEVFVAIDLTLDINERWIFEPYLLDIEPDENGDIVMPFIDYLVGEYDSVHFVRDSIIDTKRSAFTGMSTISISFSNESEALDYASKLNSSHKRG